MLLSPYLTPQPYCIRQSHLNHVTCRVATTNMLWTHAHAHPLFHTIIKFIRLKIIYKEATELFKRHSTFASVYLSIVAPLACPSSPKRAASIFAECATLAKSQTGFRIHWYKKARPDGFASGVDTTITKIMEIYKQFRGATTSDTIRHVEIMREGQCLRCFSPKPPKLLFRSVQDGARRGLAVLEAFEPVTKK